jgi:hypothetical protein
MFAAVFVLFDPPSHCQAPVAKLKLHTSFVLSKGLKYPPKITIDEA